MEFPFLCCLVGLLVTFFLAIPLLLVWLALSLLEARPSKFAGLHATIIILILIVYSLFLGHQICDFAWHGPFPALGGPFKFDFGHRPMPIDYIFDGWPGFIWVLIALPMIWYRKNGLPKIMAAIKSLFKSRRTYHLLILVLCTIIVSILFKIAGR